MGHTHLAQVLECVTFYDCYYLPGVLSSLPTPETMPCVRVWSRPNGLPMAYTFWPTSKLEDCPRLIGFVSSIFEVSHSNCRTAMSLSASPPISCISAASMSKPSFEHQVLVVEDAKSQSQAKALWNLLSATPACSVCWYAFCTIGNSNGLGHFCPAAELTEHIPANTAGGHC